MVSEQKGKVMNLILLFINASKLCLFTMIASILHQFFQSKGKKMAVDYENLKRSAQLLIEENQKLKMKLEKLVAVSIPGMEAHGRSRTASSLVSMCSSCYRAKSL